MSKSCQQRLTETILVPSNWINSTICLSPIGISGENATTGQNYCFSRATWRTSRHDTYEEFAHSIIWWPKLDEEIEMMVCSYSVCQTQHNSPPATLLIPWKWPSQPWHRLHIDYAGSFLGHMWLIIINAQARDFSNVIYHFRSYSLVSKRCVCKIQSTRESNYW